MSISLAQKSDVNPDLNQFYLNLVDWTEDGFQMGINFTTPLVVSKGRNQDALIINIKQPSLFVSQETGSPLNKKYVKVADKIPKQVPKGIDAKAE